MIEIIAGLIAGITLGIASIAIGILIRKIREMLRKSAIRKSWMKKFTTR